MHQISVFGDTKEIISEIDENKYERALSGEESITFYCGNTTEFEKLKEHLCRVLAQIIQKKYGVALLKSFYNSEKYNFSEEEKKIICSDFGAISEKGEGIIEKDIESFLKNSNSISVEGFINFRLTGYKNYIKNQLDSYEAKLEAVREYDDLIELLKAYVNTIEPVKSVINIKIMPSGGYVICDENFFDITEQCIKEAIGNKKISETSFDELLLTCLIILSPKKIVIHGENNSKNPEIIVLIKRVFGERVRSFMGCSECKM